MGRGSDEALFSEKKGFSVERGRDSMNAGFGKDFLQERQFSEEVRAIQ